LSKILIKKIIIINSNEIGAMKTSRSAPNSDPL